MINWLLVLAGVGLTAGTALFVCAEFALVTLDPAAVERHLENDKKSQRLRAGLRTLSTQLSGAQVGITATTVLLGYVTSPAVQQLLGDVMPPNAAGVATAGVFTFVLVNGFSMVFGELVPKNLALAIPLAVARVSVGPQMVFTAILRPVIVVLNNTANALLRVFGIEPKEELSGGRSPQELAALVRRSADEGTLDESTALLLTNSLAFSQLTAVDVMTDRQRVAAIDRGAKLIEVVQLARSTGHSRFPVTDGSLDDVVGLVHLKRVIAVPADRRRDVPVAALLDEAPRVPETVGLESLLVTLRDQGLQMAVVVDEYGGTSGIVTFEDVVEELVGEVADEHDNNRSQVRVGNEGTFLVPGVLRPDELEEISGLVVPDDGPYETLAGFIMAQLGRIPVAGDEVVTGDVQLRVMRMDGHRVVQVRAQRVKQ